MNILSPLGYASFLESTYPITDYVPPVELQSEFTQRVVNSELQARKDPKHYQIDRTLSEVGAVLGVDEFMLGRSLRDKSIVDLCAGASSVASELLECGASEAYVFDMNAVNMEGNPLAEECRIKNDLLDDVPDHLRRKFGATIATYGLPYWANRYGDHETAIHNQLTMTALDGLAINGPFIGMIALADEYSEWHKVPPLDRLRLKIDYELMLAVKKYTDAGWTAQFIDRFETNPDAVMEYTLVMYGPGYSGDDVVPYEYSVKGKIS